MTALELVRCLNLSPEQIEKDREANLRQIEVLLAYLRQMSVEPNSISTENRRRALRCSEKSGLTAISSVQNLD